MNNGYAKNVVKSSCIAHWGRGGAAEDHIETKFPVEMSEDECIEIRKLIWIGNFQIAPDAYFNCSADYIYFLKRLRNFRLITPNTASPNMLEFIFDSPSFLFTKMIGTSTILNFLRHALNFISI